MTRFYILLWLTVLLLPNIGMAITLVDDDFPEPNRKSKGITVNNVPIF